LKGGSLVLPGLPPTRADVAINYEESVAKLDARVTDVGDLVRVIALDTVDVSGLFLHPSPAMLTTRDGGSWIRFDTTAVISVRRGPAPGSEEVRVIGGAR